MSGDGIEPALKLQHNPDVTRTIKCKDCLVEATWNDAVAQGWVLGFESGTYRCCACGKEFEELVRKTLGIPL